MILNIIRLNAIKFCRNAVIMRLLVSKKIFSSGFTLRKIFSISSALTNTASAKWRWNWRLCDTQKDLWGLVSIFYGKLNPFVPNAPSLSAENIKKKWVFWCFQMVKKEWIGNKWVTWWEKKWTWGSEGKRKIWIIYQYEQFILGKIT